MELKLYLGFNNISDKSVKELIFPSGLQELSLRNNKIGDEGAKRLILPPGLQILNFIQNCISIDGALGIILPPGICSIYLCEMYKNEPYFILKAKIPEGIKRYAPIKKYYDFKRCKPIWKEICRRIIIWRDGRSNIQVFTKNTRNNEYQRKYLNVLQSICLKIDF